MTSLGSISELPVVAAVVQRDVVADRIAASLDTLAPLPQVAMEVVRLADDADATSEQIDDAIRKDAVVSGRVFKIAGSSFYSRGVQASTLTQAVNRLGRNTIKNLVVAASAGEIIGGPSSAYPYEVSGMWRHSLASAFVSSLVARELNMRASIRDEVFLAGVMHDIGKLVLDAALPNNILAPGMSGVAAEQQHCGLSHAELGVRVAEKWNLPDYVKSSVAHHHDLAKSEGSLEHIAVVHIADALVNNAMIGLKPGVASEVNVSPQCLTTLGIDENEFQQVRSTVEEELPDLAELCN